MFGRKPDKLGGPKLPRDIRQLEERERLGGWSAGPGVKPGENGVKIELVGRSSFDAGKGANGANRALTMSRAERFQSSLAETGLLAARGVSATRGPTRGGSLLGTVQRWFVELYRRLEGDMARFMLAPTAFKDIPKEYWPGSEIEITGIRIPKEELSRVWQAGAVPEDLKPVIDANGDYIFWFHPLALEAPPDMSAERLTHHAGEQRTMEAAHDKIMGLGRYSRIKGRAIVSSSVRTVLLFEVGGEPLQTPCELKLHLPRYIFEINRQWTTQFIEEAWAQQDNGAVPGVPLYSGASIGGNYTYEPEYDGVTQPKKPQVIPFSFGYLVRSSGFKQEGGRVHFNIPYFALFGENAKGDVILERLYQNLKTKKPDLTPHDFVIDHLVAPYIVPMFEMLRTRGILEGGLHYQNPVVRLSVPEREISESDPLAWMNGADISMEGIATKEVNDHRLTTRHDAAFIKALMTNLWTYFAGDLNWAAVFKGFDRDAFRKKMSGILEANFHPSEVPEGVNAGLWDYYVAHFYKIIKALEDPVVALSYGVTCDAEGRRPGIIPSFVHGSKVFAMAPAGLKYGSQEGFVPIFDKIGFLTFANPASDIHGLVAHENGLADKAREQCVAPESDPVSFLQEVLNEAYSEEEVAHLKDATVNHAGLAGFSEADRKWLADLIFDPEKGLFTKQLRAFRELKPKKQGEVDLEHIPHVTYWFTPIVEKMFRVRMEAKDKGDVSAILLAEKEFIKFIARLKTYDKGPLFNWLMEKFLGISAPSKGQTAGKYSELIAPGKEGLSQYEAKAVSRVVSRFEKDKALRDLRKRLFELGWKRIGIKVIYNPRIALGVNYESLPGKTQDKGELHVQLSVNPDFISEISSKELAVCLEHELRHLLFHSLFEEVTDGIKSWVGAHDVILSDAMKHFLLRSHAWRDGRAEYVDKDIEMTLDYRLGGWFNMAYPVVWLTFYVSTILDKAFVYKMAGQDRKAGDVIERIKNFFRGFDYSRFQEYPTYALPFDLSELFEAGDKMAGELFEIAKEIDESVTGEKKFSSVRWFDFIQRLIQMDQAENGFYGKVPRSHP